MSFRPPSDGDKDKECTAATRGNDFNSNTLIKYCQRRPSEPEKLYSALSSYRTPILSQQHKRDARGTAECVQANKPVLPAHAHTARHKEKKKGRSQGHSVPQQQLMLDSYYQQMVGCLLSGGVFSNLSLNMSEAVPDGKPTNRVIKPHWQFPLSFIKRYAAGTKPDALQTLPVSVQSGDTDT